MTSRPLRIGVVGLGHVGTFHARIYKQINGIELSYLCDIDRARADMASKELGGHPADDYRALIGQVDAVSLAVPTPLHYPLAKAFLRGGAHVLIEKPITTRLSDAAALIRLARARHLVLQVGHVERFNAAIRKGLEHLTHPRFIECHRLSPYPKRSTDVSVILDVMIHDLDLVQTIVRSPVRRMDAVGIPVLSRLEDIANARLTFANGCVANLTASRISDETMRKIRIFQEDTYLSIDTVTQAVDLARTTTTGIHREQLTVTKTQPLHDELTGFVEAVRTRKRPLVTGEDGKAALALALRVEGAMRRHSP